MQEALLSFIICLYIRRSYMTPIQRNFNKWLAVQCLVHSLQCSKYTAALYECCAQKQVAAQQPYRCNRLACNFCQWEALFEHVLCRQNVIISICSTINLQDEDRALSSSPNPEPWILPDLY